MECTTLLIICILAYLLFPRLVKGVETFSGWSGLDHSRPEASEESDYSQADRGCIDELQNFHNNTTDLGNCFWKGPDAFKRGRCNRALHNTDSACNVYAAGYPSIKSLEQCQALKKKYPLMAPVIKNDWH